MALDSNKDLKLYYSIKEVAKMFEVNESTLRYWETVFPKIHPKTTAKGVRQYTKQDIEEIRLVHNMVKVRGYKLEAARKAINANHEQVDKTTQIMDTLISCREQLKDLKKQLDTLV